jgi:queuine/archaeosine tRNA-ribosyltransferase
VSELQKVGYRYVALGGMAHLKTKDILTCLQTVHQVRHSSTKLHLLGVTRINELASYDSWGVASIDSTSPLKMAFKDSKNNYFTSDRAYSAIRIPQVEGNADLLKEIQGGRVSQELALKLEKRCLQAMADFDAGRCSADDVASVIAEFERLFNPKSNRQQVYRDVLEERPWKQCPCQICRDIGYHVILFRGSERNKRRAFHNLEVFYQRLQRLLIGIDELKAAV